MSKTSMHGGLTVFSAMICFLLPMTAAAQPDTLKIAVTGSLTIGSFYGVPALEGARMAVDEANAESGQPRIEIEVTDDKSSVAEASKLAQTIISGDALVTVGPDLTVIASRTNEIYARGNLASIVPTAHGDDIPKAATSFQPIFNTGQLGSALANYLHYVLRGNHAVVLYNNDAFGTPIAQGFKREAEHLGIDAAMVAFSNASERDRAAAAVAADPSHPVPAIATLGDDAVALIKDLRRGGITGPILGPDAISGDAFASLFKDEPEEKLKPGFFTNNVYAASPILLDSADNDVLAFAEGYRARYGHAPLWAAVQGYDSARLAIAAVRHAAMLGAGASKEAKRRAAVGYLASLNGGANTIQGVTGPLWFTPDRGRAQPVRMGVYENGLFESAPLQITPVINPDRSEIATGTLLDIGPGQYARFQQVVYTGIYLNEIPRLDMPNAAFTADFYLWLRYVPPDGRRSLADPADLSFPDLVRGSFDPKQPAVRRDQDDGTIYSLWRLRGDFKNEFDLRRFPMDQQQLNIRLFNAKAAADRIVYVMDRQSFDHATPAPRSGGGLVSSAFAGDVESKAAPSRLALQAAPDAFRDLTQWRTLGVAEFRENLVTRSGLGDPTLVGLARHRELSGFGMTIDIERQMRVTLTKSLLPLCLMTLIMFAALYFPHGLVKEKITVAITGALSGAVLLAAVNAQLGNVGYTMAVEYVFYIFFGLCLFSILSVLVAERLRVAGRADIAVRSEVIARAAYAATVIAVVIAAAAAASAWHQ
jgi:ABC-type branched-subunit amino acid transport system substrate-binding protein